MDSPPSAPSTLETLRTVEFRLGLKGYNVDEVDEYLEKAAVEAEALQEQMRQLTDRLRQASERIAQLEGERREAAASGAPAAAAAAPAAEPVADDSLQRTLLLAQKFVDQAKRESEAEAAEVIAQAEDRARATLAQADERARQMVTDAERRLREEVTRLEGMRTQLASDVENMARHLEAERSRLRTSLAEVLKWVDENIQPANALMALRPRATESRGPDPARSTSRPPAQAAPTGGDPGGPDGDHGAQVLDLRAGAPAGGTIPGEHR